MKNKTVYVCKECDYQSAKWLGKCPSCGAWNTMIEETFEMPSAPVDSKNARQNMLVRAESEEGPVMLGEAVLPEYLRYKTDISEFDRVLGGGVVAGSVILLSGEPGIGKSTLLLQICAAVADEKTVLYVSGEESSAQISMRARRLGIKSKNVFLLTETNVEKILRHAEKIKPDVIVVDSIQTMYHTESASIPGSSTQIRECASMFINVAKTDSVSVILVGHVTKEGSIAGPKVLEHMVDTVLYFEGDQRQNCRLIRAMKNRFGSTNEIGVFEMTDSGLSEVENPSAMLIADRPKGVSGNCAVCVIEGTRPLIAEIQALATTTVFPSPRRTSTGLDYNRLALILAVLEKRLGLRFSSCDIYLNVIGGIRIEETASDVGMALALISTIRDIPIPDELICIGELGLSGEVRTVSRMETRVAEAARLGFTEIVIPSRSQKSIKKIPDGVKLIPVKNVFDLLPLLKAPQSQKA